MRLQDDAPETEYLKCAACGRDAECGIWGTGTEEKTHVCYPCCSDWYAKAPTCGEVPKDMRDPDGTEKFYRAFTAKWLEAKRKAAA